MTSQSDAVKAAYLQRKSARQSELAEALRRHGRAGNLRFVSALAAIALALLAYRARSVPPALVWLPVAVFVALALWQWRLGLRRLRLSAMLAFWEHGLARIEDRWSGTGPDGQSFADEGHLYARDLDLFGRGSLFQLLCQARTREGQACLAGWLTRPAPAEEVSARQAAVRELGPRLDLREALALAGREQREELRAGALRAWALAPPVAWPRGRRFGTRLLMMMLAALALVVAPLAFTGRISGLWLAALLLIDLLVMASARAYTEPAQAQSSARLAALDALAALLRVIEDERFEAPALRALHARLVADGQPSRRVRQIGRLVSLFDAGRNQLLIPIAYPLFLPHQVAFAIEDWRVRHGAAIVRWLDAVAEIEALVSLGAFSYERPDFVFPTLTVGAPAIVGAEVGHPLLPAARRVCNDVEIGGRLSDGEAGPRLLLISGSNMSGKSTYLRTVGVNVVLALAGAPVCARSFRLTPVRIGATLDVHDSLQEGRSRFYAEIVRIRSVVALTETRDEKAPTVLFLFDEILHGTNSADRQTGAAGVLRGLLQRDTLGLTTTHDLALTRIADDVGAATRNVHFQDSMEGDEMKFDYKLRDGVVTRSNAIALMRAVGLPV